MKTDNKKSPQNGQAGKVIEPVTGEHCDLFKELFNLSPTPYFLINPAGEIVNLNLTRVIIT